MAKGRYKKAGIFGGTSIMSVGIGVVIGAIFSDKIKPLMQKLPVVGTMVK